MIGIFFLFVFGFWAVIAVVLGSKMSQWLGFTSYRKTLSVVLALLIFVAPVADEILAYPQMMELCSSLKPFELAPGMDEKKAYGRTVEQTLEINEESLWPSTVKVTRWDLRFVDTSTAEPVLVYSRFQPRRGMLGLPSGSGGDQMAVLLKNCSDVKEQFDSQGLPRRFKSLNLQIKQSR